VLPLASAADGLRSLATAKSTGKVVLVPPASAVAAVPAGRWTVIGGAGALGGLAAHWLAGRGARHIALLGRGVRALPAAAARAAAAPGWAASLSLAAADASTRADASDCFGLGGTHSPPPVGVLHCGGATADASLPRVTPARARAAAAAKSVPLDRTGDVTAAHPLHCMALYSSIASALGSGGQAAYAAANAALDAGATARAHAGLPTASINWGAWSGGGMAQAAGLDRMARLGHGALAPGAGVAALAAALRGIVVGGLQPRLLATVFLWDRLKADGAFWEGVKPPKAPVAALLPAAVDAPATARTPLPSTLHTLASVLARVEAAVAIVAGHPVPRSAPLADAGVDSLGAVELRNALGSAFGVDLPASLVYDHPSVEALAAWLAGKVCRADEGAAPPPLPAPPPPLARVAAPLAVAIDAVSGRTPVGPPSGLWTPDGVAPVRLSRWDGDARGAPARFGAAVAGVALFDAPAFGVSPPEAATMDPAQRLLLLDAAALVPTVPGGSVAVAVGVARIADEAGAWPARHAPGPFDGTGRALSVVAGRLSYVFGLKV